MGTTATTNWILELVDRVTGPINKIDSAMNVATKTTDKFTSHLKSLETQQSSLQKKMGKFTIGAAALYGLSRGALKFEDSMAKVNTMVSGGETVFKNLQEGAMKLSTEVGFARTEIADGLYGALSAGVPEDNAIDFITNSSKAAKGGISDINTVVSATSSIIKNYGDEWRNAGKIQDKFQLSAKLGELTLGELASALPRVTTLAAQLNMTQSELMSTFATASGPMGKPAELATQLQATLAALMKPSSEAIEMANKLGVAFDAKSIGKAGGLNNYIQELMPQIKAFSEQSGQTQESIVGKLFGSQEAIKMVMGLGGELSEKWTQNTAQMNNATGAVEEAFNKVASTSNQKGQRLKNGFGMVVTRITDALAPLISNLMDVGIAVAIITSDFMGAHPVLTKVVSIIALLTGVIYGVTIAVKLYTVSQRIANLTGAQSILGFAKQIGRLALLAAGYTLLGTLMVAKYVGGLIVATAAQWGLNVAMNANPIGLIIIGVMALVGVITLVIKYWDTLKIYLINFAKFFFKISPFGFMLVLIEKIFPGFKEKLKGIFDSVKKWLGGLWDIVKNIFNKIAEFFGFGGEAEVKVKTKNLDEKEAATDTAIDTDTSTAGNLFVPKGGYKNSEISGGGSSKKSTIMTINVVNNFNVAAGRMRDEAERLAEEVVGRINDQMRDVVIADG